MTGQKISSWCRTVVRYIAILLVGYLFLQGLFTICCIRRVEEKTYYMENNVLTQLVGIAVFFSLTLFLRKKDIQFFLEKHYKRIVTGILFLMTVFLIIWIANTRFWYYGDTEKIFADADSLLHGNYSPWYPGGYSYMWPHQNGMVLFVAMLLKCFSLQQVFAIFYGCNILSYVTAVISVIFCVKELFPNKSTNCMQAIMVIGYLPYSFFCTFMYGDMIGFGFACISIVMVFQYLKKQKCVWLLGAAVSMVFAIIFKQNELIIFVALMMLLVFDAVEKKEKRGRRILWIAICATIVLAGMKVPNLIVEQITGAENTRGNSKWAHLAMGLQEGDKAWGWYNSYNYDVFVENNYDKEATTKASIESIKETVGNFVENPSYAWKFFNYKLASEWNNPTFECFHIQNFRLTTLELSSVVKSTINDGGKINILLIYLLDIGQSILLFGVLLYLIAADKADWRQLLFALIFIGGFVFFMFWEAKSRYVLPFFFVLIPYCYVGYQRLAERVSQTVKERKLSWNKLYSALVVIALMIVLIAVCDSQWIMDSFKINIDTEAYYEYIHQYNKNFMNLRF